MDRTTTTKDRIDWRAERERIDLVAVARSLLGEEIRRQGRVLLWLCPFHDDHSPSFVVDPVRRRWNCYPCGLGGDAVALAMKLEGLSFSGAVARLMGRPAPSGRSRPRPSPTAQPRPKPEPPEEAKGLPEPEALDLVAKSEARLWSREGSEALAYLTDRRCLSRATIQVARLGWTPRAKGVPWAPPGIVIPWSDLDTLSLVKLRPPDEWRLSFPEGGRPPKYIEAFRDQPRYYPTCRAIQPGYPLIIVEGELDALLLGQELEGLAGVVTLGGTGSTRPDPGILGAMLPAWPWYIATDADEAGDKAAARWAGTRAKRVRPPEPFKDRTEARQARIKLRRWWSDRLAGNPAPKLFVWEELAEWRWGTATREPDPEPIASRPIETHSINLPVTPDATCLGAK